MNLIYCLRNNDAVSCVNLKSSFLMVGSESVSIWDLRNGKMISKLHARCGNILKIITSNEQAMIHARDNCIKVCSWPDMIQISSISVNTCNFCAFDRDQHGRLYYPADDDSNKILIMDSSKSSSNTLSPPYNAGIVMCLFTFCHDGELNLAVGFEDGSVAMWDLNSGICQINKDHSEPVLSVYVIEEVGVISGGADGKLVIRYFSTDLETFDSVEFDGVKGVACISYSSSRKMIAAGGWNGSVYLIPVLDINNYSTIEFHRGRINDVLFLDDPKRVTESEDAEDWICPEDSLMVGSADGRVSIWELNSV